MNEFEYNLFKNLPNSNLDDFEYEQVQAISNILEENFNFSSLDIFYICFACPQILKCDKYEFEQNVLCLSKIYNLKSKQIEYFVLKYPFVLTINYKYLDYKNRLLSQVFSSSFQDVLEILFVYSDIMFLGKEKIKHQIEMISKAVDEYGIGLRRIFKSNPSALFVSEEKISDLKEILMKQYTLSSFEANKVLKTAPELLSESEEYLTKKLNYFYPKYFVKRDFKEILPNFPALLLLTESEFGQNLIDITRTLDICEKDICKFIRHNPDCLFVDDFKKKIIGFKKLNINDEYIKENPSVLSCLEISLPIKFVIARILGLENYFFDICKMNTRLFLSRFLFMQMSNKFDHVDLLLSEDEFYSKYGISSKMLQLSYKIELPHIENICKYYVSLKEKMLGWTDIVFPSLAQIQEFLLEKNNSQNSNIVNYFEVKEKYHLTINEYEVYKVLNMLHFNFTEYLLIRKKCNAIKSIVPNTVLKLVEYLRKNGLAYEEILNLIISKPHILTYNIKDFDVLLQEIVEYENCNFSDAIYKFL
ncbi:MAG: hypothetical protein IJS74_02180 [Clostridia bacterium]|nr:hypothetical protein [Clostridia bacterium]